MFNNLVKSVSSWTSSSSSFPYTLGEEILEWKQSSANNHNSSVWKLYEAKKSGGDEEEKYTVFALMNRKTEMQNRVDAAMNALSKLKSIRHPNILSYVDCLIADDKILLVTEYVYPLVACIEGAGNACKLNESFVALGLHQLSSALSFVHNDLKHLHCLVSPSAVFVNQAGDWKLSGFELSHKYKERPPSHFATNFDVLLPSKYRPKELTKTHDIVNILLNNPIHSMDAWCVGCIIFELFSCIHSQNDLQHSSQKSKFTKPQQLSNLSAIPYALQKYYKRLLATSASSRITLTVLCNDCDFITQNSLVQTAKFIEEIAIKSDAEKRRFLQHLDENIQSYPPDVCKYKILPTLTHLLQHGFGSNPLILSCVLKISSSFIDDEKEKAQKITPVVINMFKNNERGTRINLLKSLPKFIDYLDSDTISNDIWPQLINGFTDSSPVLREQSVRSVIHFTPKLKEKLISSQLLPLLDKIQGNDVEPAIRTNICIVLGKIAKYVPIKNNQTNELLLVKAFGRALGDSFEPCRNASLLSFAATISLFSPTIIATKILPAVMRYTCDPHKTVRDSAFKCIELGLQKLKQHALTLPDKPITSNPENDGTQSTHTANTNNPGDAAADSSNSYLGNVTSWASRLSGYSANSEDQKTGQTQSPKAAPNSSATPTAANATQKAALPSSNKSNDISVDDLDDLFAESNVKPTKGKQKDTDNRKSNGSVGMQLKKHNDSTQEFGDLDDFLKSFTDDLDKRSTQNEDTTPPKSKIKHKHKNKKAKKHKKSKKKEKPMEKDNDNGNDNADDFFDDW